MQGIGRFFALGHLIDSCSVLAKCSFPLELSNRHFALPNKRQYNVLRNPSVCGVSASEIDRAD
jgi:hypothetical protein